MLFSGSSNKVFPYHYTVASNLNNQTNYDLNKLKHKTTFRHQRQNYLSHVSVQSNFSCLSNSLHKSALIPATETVTEISQRLEELQHVKGRAKHVNVACLHSGLTIALITLAARSLIEYYEMIRLRSIIIPPRWAGAGAPWAGHVGGRRRDPPSGFRSSLQ